MEVWIPLLLHNYTRETDRENIILCCYCRLPTLRFEMVVIIHFSIVYYIHYCFLTQRFYTFYSFTLVLTFNIISCYDKIKNIIIIVIITILTLIK